MYKNDIVTISRRHYIMDAKEIIEDEADRFYHEKLIQYRGLDDEHKLFKNDLQSELYNYNEPVDKLIYLYRVSLNIANEYEKHLKNCPIRIIIKSAQLILFIQKRNILLNKKSRI